MKILIVEDDSDQGDTLSRLLRKIIGETEDTLTICQARSLAEGIKMSWEVRADITLLDPGLPDAKDKDGKPDYTIVGQAIKDKKFYPPVIITTGMPDPTKSLEVYFMKCGAQQVFHKPYIEQVVALIASASAGAAMRKLVAETDNLPPLPQNPV